MGKCPNCGNRGLFGPEIFQCIVCGKERCEKCAGKDLQYLFTLRRRDIEEQLPKRISACTQGCFEDFEGMVLEKIDITAEEVGTDSEQSLFTEIHSAAAGACLQVTAELNPKLIDKLTHKGYTHPLPEIYYGEKGPGAGLQDSPLFRKCFRQAITLLAQNLESGGHLVRAAQIYESLQM